MLNSVDSKKRLPEIEHEMLAFWEKEGIFEKSLERRKKSKKFVFFDGPPFANGLPHYGHILASALKDAVTRYWTMQGFYVPRVNGWDCHGLPVEYEIEKELKLSGRKDIIKLGVEKFNNACRESVFRYTAQWEQLLKRIARWVDMKHSYATLENEYMQSIWWIFGQIWKKKLVYEGYKPMHICPRCETSLSNFEVTLGYKEVADLSIIMKFPLVDEPNTFFLAWTTTPWSSLSVTGLAVGPSFDYSLVELPDKSRYYCASARVESVFAGVKDKKIITTVRGSDIIHKKYRHLYDFYNARPETLKSKWAFHTVPADYVSVEDGTGIVTINGAFGDVDFESATKWELPIFVNVKSDGTFTEETGKFAGIFVKKAEPMIAEDLSARGLLLRKDPIRHNYPHCWRCDTPLLNYVTKAWFIRVTDFKEKLLKNNKKIHWIPSHIQEGRFGKWLEGARDWNISRNRFWGCPIPLWRCECGEVVCIDSLKELKKRSKNGALPLRNGELDLHKPYIDDITIACEACGKEARRVSEVFDCWFESGAMPYAQLHYPFENKKEFERNFPADFIGEGLDQTRGWFYTLHVISTILFNKPAFKNCVVNGILLAANGEKLSKRKKNYPDPNALFETHGVDTTRMFLYTSTAPLAEDVRFSEKHVEELVKKFTLTLWNTYSFFVTYATIDKWEPGKKKVKSANKLDQWILSELHALIANMTNAMNEFDLTNATRPLLAFVDNLSNWYVRRSRRRFWKSENDGDKTAAYATMHNVLVTLTKLLAPFMPFSADAIFKNLTGAESVHLEDWPVAERSAIKRGLNEEVHVVRTIVSLALKLRALCKIKVRQPLQELTVALPHGIAKEILAMYRDVILEELNVKELAFASAGEIADPFITPLSPVIGPRYGKETQAIIKLAKAGDYEVKKEGTVTLPKTNPVYTLSPEEVAIGYRGKPGTTVAAQDGIIVSLATEVTPDLQQEGYCRDIIRFIQELRKKTGYTIADRIYVSLRGDKELMNAATRYNDLIKKETLALELQESGDMEWDGQEHVEIEGRKLTIALRRA